VRPGTTGDVQAIAALHAESWRSAYGGLVPDDVLGEGLDAERLQFWRAINRRRRPSALTRPHPPPPA
jgi:hypothetical protein